MPLGFGSICPSLRRGGADRFDEDREGSGFAFVESFTNRVSLGCAYSIETDLSCCWVLWSKNSLVTLHAKASDGRLHIIRAVYPHSDRWVLRTRVRPAGGLSTSNNLHTDSGLQSSDLPNYRLPFPRAKRMIL